MEKRKKDPLLEALQEGKSFTWTISEGGNLASMRKAVKHGQTLAMSPVTDTTEILLKDIVLVKWHQSTIFHIVGDIQDNKFLIVNSLGKENGWVERESILGKISKIIEPEPRPSVSALLEQLQDAFTDSIEKLQPTTDNAQRLLRIVDNLRWYADRIGEQKRDFMPHDNVWSFHQNLWRLTRKATTFLQQTDHRIQTLIDQGNQCVGKVSDIISILEKEEISNT
ncbi:MAG TPA: hypothetical protein VLA72_11280 [Anaerolineales bacterium]|nr:hypothetical protein [Anaerolineales bacterium]